MLENDVRRIRTELSWSQDELALRSGLSRAGISAIETGRLVPSTAAALALAAALGCKVEQLFRLSDAAADGPDARWAFPAGVGPRRYWRAVVAGNHLVYPVEESPLGLVPHDGIHRDGVFHDHGATEAERTLVVAGCDPAVGFLAKALAAREDGTRLIVLSRSSRAALDLLSRGIVHAAGIHLGADDDPAGNDQALNTHPAAGGQSDYHILSVAVWDEGIALSPSQKVRDIRALMKARLRWVGREPGSGARQCFDDLIEQFGSRRPARPSRQARDHRGVAEAVRSGWADAGVCVRLASDLAGLSFLPVRRECYEICFPSAMADDPRLKALVDAVRAPSYRQLLSDLPGYDTARTGQLRRIRIGKKPLPNTRTSAH